MKKPIVFPVLVMALFYSGCGMVGLMGTESQYEKRIPAEYNLYKPKDQKILVLVEQSDWFNTQANLRYYLTEAINESLTAKVKFPPKSIISYGELSEFRSKMGDFSLLSPVEIGRALGANMVLVVVIEDYKLSGLAETDYHNGFLGVQSALLETTDEGKLWPEYAESKSIKVGFEVGERGQEEAVRRLANACAHCITRYFYNCPKYKFNIFDERSDSSWVDWE